MGLFAGTKWDLPARCDRCQALESECACPPAPLAPRKPPQQQTLKVRVEKRKAGRQVTLVSGLEADDPARSELLTQLKNACGAGGGHEAPDLLIQGDHQDRVSTVLKDLGYRLR